MPSMTIKNRFFQRFLQLFPSLINVAVIIANGVEITPVSNLKCCCSCKLQQG